MTMQFKLELEDALASEVLANTGEDRPFASVQDYVAALIEEDLQRRRHEFELVRAELQRAFATPLSEYRTVSADDVIERNRLKR